MKFKLAQSTDPPTPNKPRLLYIPYIVAAYIAAVMLFQLAVLNDFLPYIAKTLSLKPDSGAAIAVAFVILFLEFFSLPFLLRLRLSYLARSVSVVILPILLVIGTIVDYLAIQRGALSGAPGIINLLKTIVLIPLAVWAFHILNTKSALQRPRK